MKPSKKKIILIIDSALTLPAHLNIFDSAKHCHIFYNKTLNAPKKNRNCTYHALAANYDKKLNLEQLMHYIGQDLGFHDVWVEAGGQLFTALHLQNLVQKTYLYMYLLYLMNQQPQVFVIVNYLIVLTQ